MKGRPLVLLFLALSGVLVAPRLVYAQLPSSPKPLTITEAYCVAQPLALAWDANALPASFKGDSPDEQLRSRTWTIFFSPQGRSGLILSVTVQDGVPSASQLRGSFFFGIFPASFNAQQALAQFRSGPFGSLQILGLEGGYDPTGQQWFLGFRTERAVVSVQASRRGDTAPFNCNPGRSNVAFFPGIEGSRLYVQKLSGEALLWEAGSDAEMCTLRPNDDGSSQPGIYTRDIVDHGFGLAGLDVYSRFISFMDDLKTIHFIKDWRAFPYDWRMNVEFIARNGITLGNNGVVNNLDLVASIEDLANSSATGKVTIVTHSNGALLAKELMRMLIEKNKSEKIDRIIMVAPPQLGTPKAVATLLHGDEPPIPFLISRSATRESGERMVGAYTLLPSQTYFDRNVEPVVAFDRDVKTSLQKLLNFRSLYPTDISSYSDLRRFILGENGARSEPVPGTTCVNAPADTSQPNVLLTALLVPVEAFHARSDTLSNTWIPIGTDLIQVVGSGISTISGIKYTSRRVCSLFGCNEVLNHVPLTTDGDGTVVRSSAAALPNGASVETFYFDLASYNNPSSADVHRKHENIMGASPVQQLIGNLLDGNQNPSIPYVLKAPVTGVDSLHITIASPVTLHAYDSAGRHTGPIPMPNRPTALVLEEQIPSGSFSQVGHNTYLTLSTNDQYRIELRGQELGTFTLTLEEFVDNDLKSTLTYVDIPASKTTNGSLAIQHVSGSILLQLDVNGDGVTDFTLTPSTQPDVVMSLRVLTAVVKTLGLPRGIENSLTSKLDAATAAVQRGNHKAAIGVLGAFENEVQAQSGKSIPVPDGNGLIIIANQLLTSI